MADKSAHGRTRGVPRYEIPDQKKFWESIDELEECANAVGWLCFEWANLERTLDSFTTLLLNRKNAKASETLMHNIDMRDKVRIATGLAHMRKPSSDWFRAVKWCLDKADNDLRSRRNRFVHDEWGFDSGGLWRRQKKTGFHRPQAFKLDYYTKVHWTMKVEDIRALNHELRDMGTRLVMLALPLLKKGSDWKKPLAELKLLPPRQA